MKTLFDMSQQEKQSCEQQINDGRIQFQGHCHTVLASWTRVERLEWKRADANVISNTCASL